MLPSSWFFRGDQSRKRAGEELTYSKYLGGHSETWTKRAAIPQENASMSHIREFQPVWYWWSTRLLQGFPIVSPTSRAATHCLADFLCLLVSQQHLAAEKGGSWGIALPRMLNVLMLLGPTWFTYCLLSVPVYTGLTCLHGSKLMAIPLGFQTIG